MLIIFVEIVEVGLASTRQAETQSTIWPKQSAWINALETTILAPVLVCKQPQVCQDGEWSRPNPGWWAGLPSKVILKITINLSDRQEICNDQTTALAVLDSETAFFTTSNRAQLQPGLSVLMLRNLWATWLRTSALSLTSYKHLKEISSDSSSYRFLSWILHFLATFTGMSSTLLPLWLNAKMSTARTRRTWTRRTWCLVSWQAFSCSSILDIIWNMSYVSFHIILSYPFSSSLSIWSCQYLIHHTGSWTIRNIKLMFNHLCVVCFKSRCLVRKIWKLYGTRLQQFLTQMTAGIHPVNWKVLSSWCICFECISMVHSQNVSKKIIFAMRHHGISKAEGSRSLLSNVTGSAPHRLPNPNEMNRRCCIPSSVHEWSCITDVTRSFLVYSDTCSRSIHFATAILYSTGSEATSKQ